MTTATPWVRDGDAMHCTRHGQMFVLPMTCPACGADPGPPIDLDVDEPLDPPPAGCLSPEDGERWFVALAQEAKKAATSLARKRRRDFHDESAIAKHRDNAVKAMRAASDLATRRQDEEIVRKRERRIQERARGTRH